MLIIGLSGKAGSGKSTVADHLIAHYGFRRVKFAAPLKAMLSTLLATRGVEPEHIERMIEGDLKEVPSPWLNGNTPRHAMVTLGTEWGRDLWVYSAVDMLALIRVAEPDARIVVDDVRFPNELDAIRDRGGHVWRIGDSPLSGEPWSPIRRRGARALRLSIARALVELVAERLLQADIVPNSGG